MTEAADSAKRPRRMARRFVLGFVLAFGGLAALWTGTIAILSWQKGRAVEKLRQQGEPATFAEAVQQNVASSATPTANKRLYDAIDAHVEAGRPGDVYGTTGFNRPVAPIKEPLRSQWKSAVSKSTSVLTLLERAVEDPPGPLMLPNEMADLHNSMVFPRALELRGLGWLTMMDLRLAADERDWPRAARRLHMLLRIADHFSREPFFGPQLHRLMTFDLAFDAIGFLAPSAEFSQAEFDGLDKLLATADQDFKMGPALKNERLISSQIIEGSGDASYFLQRHLVVFGTGSTLPRSAALKAREAWAAMIVTPLGLPFRLRRSVESLECPDEVFALIDTPPPWPKSASSTFEQWKSAIDPGSVGLWPEQTTFLDRAVSQTTRVHRRIALSRAALRLRRFQLQFGRLPNSLAELNELGMPAIPLTWFENEPLVVEKTPNGCRISGPNYLLRSPLLPNDSQKSLAGLLIELRFTVAPTSNAASPK